MANIPTVQATADDYDPIELNRLGAIRKRAMSMLDDIEESIERQIVAAGFARVPQADVVRKTGMDRERIRDRWRRAGVPAERP